MRLSRLCRLTLFVGCAALLVAACGHRPRIAWPAYAPGYGAGDTRLTAAAGAVGIVVVDDDISARSFDPVLDSWIRGLLAKKQKVFGYVPVCNGSLGLTDGHPASCPAPPAGGSTPVPTAPSIQARINNLKAYPELTGVYLDEGPLDDGTTKWYDDKTTKDHWLADIEAAQAGSKGWKVMVEAAGYSEKWLADASDFILLWEDNCKTPRCENFDTEHKPCVESPPDNTQGNCTLQSSAPDWWKNNKKVVNTLCLYNPNTAGMPADVSDFDALFENAKDRGVGYLGVTNSDCRGKLGAIPPYWDAEVKAAGK